ncbi:MAG: hypothetical protein JST42_05185 [Bacteroidetes bacterium]|nr:hypothetical protein [Bacteroidota bacterium]
MRRIRVYTIAVVICLFPAGSLLAQRRHPPAAPPPVLKATVDKQKIVIGEPIQLMLEATVPGDGPLTWPNLDSLPHFEFLEKGKVDSTVKSGERYYRQYLTVTSFDSGAYAIPRLTFVEGNKKYFSDSVRIDIGYSKFDPSKDYHDIKDIIEVPNPFARWFPWIVGGVALVCLVLVVWLIRKRKLLRTGGVAKDEVKLTPYEEAISQLRQLELQKHLLSDGSAKVYYSRLGDIFRYFLLRRLGIASLAETSDELIGQLRRLSLPGDQFAALSDTLRMSDFVKFAKYQPGLADGEQHHQTIRGAIDTLEKITAGKEAAAAAAGAQASAGHASAGQASAGQIPARPAQEQSTPKSENKTIN